MSTIPSYRSTGTAANSTGSISVGLPSGWQQNDLLVLLVETANQAITTPTGWTQFTPSPQGTGTAAGTAATRLSAYYKIAGASESAVSITDTADHKQAFMMAFSGVDTTTPINISAGDVAATASTAVTIPSVTTTVANCLIVDVVANATDTVTAQNSAWANAALSSVTERADSNTTAGNGGGIGVATGGKATAGSTGTTTATLATSSVQGRIKFAIAPQITFSMPVVTGTFSLTGKAVSFRYFHLQANTGTFSLTGQNVTLTGPPRDKVLESFEAAPLSGDVSWTDNSGGTMTVTSSTSYVTQGTHSWRFQAPSGGAVLAESSSAINLTGYARLTLDGFFTSVGANSGVILSLQDNTATQFLAATPLGQTGAFTLSIDLTTSTDLSNCVIDIFGVDWDGTNFGTAVFLTSAIDFNLDNLFVHIPSANAYTLTADQGSFTLTGIAATLKDGRYEPVTTGSFTLTGKSAGLIAARKMPVSTGTFSLTGKSVGFITTHKMSIGAGSFSLTGIAANLKRNSVLAASTGSFVLTGINAALTKQSLSSYVLGISAGGFSLSGIDARLLKGSKVSPVSGSLILTGKNTSFQYDRIMQVSAGAFLLTGKSVGFNDSRYLAANSGSFALNGIDAVLRRNNRLSAAPASFNIAYNSIALDRGYLLFVSHGSYSLSGHDATLLMQWARRLKVFLSGAFVAKPVKIWNGVAWIVKHLKFWNGTDWI